MKQPAERLIRLFSFLTAHPRAILWAAVALAIVSAVVGLRLPFLTARSAMLPQDLPESRRFESFLQEFGAGADLIVVLEGAPTAQVDRFAQELVELLETQPDVRSALRGIAPATLMQLGWNLLPAGLLRDLERDLTHTYADLVLPETLGAAIEWGAQRLARDGLALPDLPLASVIALKPAFALFDEVERWLDAPEAPTALNVQAIAASVGAEAALEGAFRAHDGLQTYVFVRAQAASEAFEVVGPFVEAVRGHAEGLAQQWRAQGLTPPLVGLAGLPAVVAEEFEAVQADVGLVVLSAAGLIALLVLIGLRSWRRALVIFLPMGIGVAWNLGLTALLIGHLTILTSSFTAILFGLGVDYGILLSAEILLQDRAAGWRQAVVQGAARAFRPLLVAGGATALVFAGLIPSAFPGFAELGVLAAVGVVSVWGATILVQPALLCVLPLEKKLGAAAPVAGGQDGSEAAAAPARRDLPLTWARPVTILALGLVAVGGLAVTRIPFDYDALSLLPKGSEVARLQRQMQEKSDFQPEVIVVPAADLAEARRLGDRLEALPQIATVQRADMFFPPDAAERAQRARAIGHQLEAGGLLAQIHGFSPTLDGSHVAQLRTMLGTLRAELERMQTAQTGGLRLLGGQLGRFIERLRALETRLEAPHARARLEALARAVLAPLQQGADLMAQWSRAQALTPKTLPAALRERFVSESGQLAIYAFPARSVYEPQALDELLDAVYAVSPEATGFPTTHRVFSKIVVRAFYEGTGLALLLASLWVIFSLRHFAAVVVGLLPLLAGGGAMLTVLWLGGFSFNFANIVALPLVMGLALDYGLWFAHQRLDHPQLSARAVAQRTWRPILLAAATTFAGLGAITLARYQGVSTMGFALSLGLLCCLLAALGAAPLAAAWLMPRKPPRSGDPARG